MSTVHRTRPLGEVVTITKGRKPKLLESLASEGSMPYATTDLLRTGVASQFIPADELSGCILTQSGDPVLIWDGSNAGEIFLGRDAVLASTMARVQPDASIVDPAFCYFFLKTAFADLNGGTTGSTIPHVSRQTLTALPVPVMDLPEQRSISAILSTLETAISIQTQAIEAVGALKRAVMQKLFTRGLRGGEPQDSEIGPIPQGWDVRRFSDIREWLQYGTSARSEFGASGSPVLRIPNIEVGHVSTKELKYAALSASEVAKYSLEPGDLLFIRTNGVKDRLGTCAVFTGEPEGALFASYLIRARLKEGTAPKYVSQFFASPIGTPLVTDRATPASDGKFNLNTATIDDLPIPMPATLEEQQQIVDILDAIDAKIDLHRQKKAVYEELFQALLHGLMTRDIDVTDLDLSALPTIEAVPA